MSIELLKIDDHYYGDEGKKYLSNSDISALLYNPRTFRKDRPDTKSLIEGNLFHKLLLEPDKVQEVHVVDATTRTTKVYKEYVEANQLEIAMLKHEYDKINELSQRMRSNMTFYDAIYKEGNTYEQPAVGEIFGEMWKGKADIVSADSLIDIKTTSDIHQFKYSARKYNYDSQCYIYQKLFGKPLMFYVIDKETAQLGVFMPSKEFVEGGKEKVARAIEQYRKFFGPDAEHHVEDYFIIESL
jgi:hypothetical protein